MTDQKRGHQEELPTFNSTLAVSSGEGPHLPSQAKKRRYRRVSYHKPLLFVASLVLFILAIFLMKEGALSLQGLIQNTFAVDNALNGLGFGWLFAYVLLSGSPVAAASLAFFDVGAIDALTTLTMITGSRIGANFLVLLLGFLYILRGRHRATSLGMGLLSFGVTGFTHIIGLLLGVWMLQRGIFSGWRLSGGFLVHGVFDRLFDPIVSWCVSTLPGWMVFGFGIGLIIVSFSLFDRCLPQMTLRESQVGHLSRLVYRPWVMFLLGAGLTMISMSVSISLGILVPLSQRGFVRRENVIPYIMGANITTFVDTLIASLLFNNSVSFEIVLVEIVSMTLVSAFILATSYRRFEHNMLRFVTWVSLSTTHLSLFMIAILLIPLILLLV